MLLRWGSSESKTRGLRDGEVVIFSSGEYSDYGLSRIVMTTRAVSADELEEAAQQTELSDNGRPEELGWRYLHDGSLIETMIAKGAFKEVPVCELHTEPVFAKEGGPGINIDLTEH